MVRDRIVNRLDSLFERTRRENRAALIAYLPAGFPSVEGSADALLAMVDAGVDAVEVGFPYSDPVMDGPTIEAAAATALLNGTTPHDVLQTVEKVAATGTPTLVMSYWNPIERYGVINFARDLAAAGGCGVITPDLTIDEADPWLAAVSQAQIDPIFVVAPSTSPDRLRRVTQACSGFVYAASTMGVTGTRTSVSSAAPALVERIREITALPISVGLGVSNRDQAAQVASYADGVIVGSAFVRAILNASTPAEGVAAVASLAAELAAGVRR
jgi:tryptophan synthase alpha chain